jgi:hypothetical protein
MTTVDRKTAETDFNRFKEAMRLRLDRETMDSNERRDVNDDVDIIIDEIMRGILSVDDDGRLVLHPIDRDPITFSRPKAAALAAIDRQKEHQKIGQGFALASEFCDVAPSVLKHQLWQDEFDTVQRITGLFFVK